MAAVAALTISTLPLYTLHASLRRFKYKEDCLACPGCPWKDMTLERPVKTRRARVMPEKAGLSEEVIMLHSHMDDVWYFHLLLFRTGRHLIHTPEKKGHVVWLKARSHSFATTRHYRKRRPNEDSTDWPSSHAMRSSPGAWRL